MNAEEARRAGEDFTERVVDPDRDELGEVPVLPGPAEQ
jgi:hypothetical protein